MIFLPSPSARNRSRASRRYCLKPLVFLLAAGALASAPPVANAARPDSAEKAGDSASARSHPMPANGDAREPASAGEMRGLWVVRTSLVSPQSVHQVVVTAAKYHLNALFVQVRGRGDAWYNSPYEPRAEPLARQPRAFDPLAQLIAEAHAAGLQVHAWMNTYLTWSGSRPPASPQHLWNAHRDWFACDRKGHCSPVPNNACEGAFLQPSNPAVQQHLFNVFTDVATRYDVDGIHFDYCRYAGSDYDFSSSTLGRFRAFMAEQLAPEQAAQIDRRLRTDRLAYVHAFGAQWQDWRRAQVTNLVARISAAVKAAKPGIQVSAAVFPNADEAFRERGQDWRGWLKAGYLDAVALMAYEKNTERVLEQTRQAIAASGGGQVYTGIGAWRLSAHDVAHKIILLRRLGVDGINLFSYDGVHTRNRYLDTLARGVFASRAAPPNRLRLPPRKASEETSPPGR